MARVVVVNPHQFKVISESVKKTDRNDAAALALYLEKDLLPEVRMKPKQNRELMHLAETRDLLVKLTLGAEGQDQQPAGDAGDRVEAGSLVEQDCAGAGAGTAGQRDGAVGVADSGGADPGALSESIAELDERLEEEGQQLPGYENLTSIKGIGSLSATVLLTVIGKISDFADENKLASYLGLVPKIANSNESERSGRITKQGNKLARTALVQCGLSAKRYSPYLQGFYERIKQRRGGGKAKIALARKLVKIVHDTLKNQWVFEDFPSFTLAA